MSENTSDGTIQPAEAGDDGEIKLVPDSGTIAIRELRATNRKLQIRLTAHQLLITILLCQMDRQKVRELIEASMTIPEAIKANGVEAPELQFEVFGEVKRITSFFFEPSEG